MSLRRLSAAFLGLLLLSACAPMIQHAARPPAGFQGPRLEADRFVSFDGVALGLSRWEPAGEPWAVIVGLHGINDYGNAFWMAGPWWARDGIATLAFDQRGFGRSPQRGVWGGPLMAEDVRTLCALARARYPHAIIAVAGESMGGAVALDAFGSARPPDADRLVLLAPAVWGWSSQPLINRVALWVGARVIGSRVIEPPRRLASHYTASDNTDELLRMGRDPEMIWGTRPDAVYGLVTLMERASKASGSVRAPTLYLYGAHDQFVPAAPSFAAAARLGPGARTAWYANGWHLLLRDEQAITVWRDVESFLRDPKAPLPSGAPPIPKP